MIRDCGPRCRHWWSRQAGAKTIEGKQHPDRDPHLVPALMSADRAVRTYR
ncbi:hypothetical protein AB0M11_31480 [Streptomyces sp. NPDC051987]